MAKKTLVLEFDDAGDEGFDIYVNAIKTAVFLDDWENLIRRRCKYGSEEEVKIWDGVREEYFRLKSENEL